MIRLFKNNTFFTLIAVGLVLTCLGILLHYAGNMPPRVSNPTPLAHLFIEFLATEGSAADFYWALGLILIQSILFGLIAEKNQLLYKNTYLPALFYGLISMLFPEQLELNPELIASFFLLIAVLSLFSTQGQRQALPALINAGFLGGLAFLISPSTVIYVPVFFVGIFYLKPSRAIDFAQFLFGYLITLFTGFTLLYGLGASDIIQAYLDFPIWQNGTAVVWTNVNFVYLISLLLLVLVPTFFRLQQNFFRNTVRVRKLQGFLVVYLIFSVPYALFGSHTIQTAASVMALPASVFFTYFFLPDKRKWLYEFIFLLILFGLLAQHFQWL